MSAYAFVNVSCDRPDCYARFESHRTKVTEARQDAAKQGWRHIAGMDFCGPKEKAEQYSTTSYGWNGCAELDDHLPIVTTARKGEVKLSCKCGWIYTPKYSWERPGEVPRSSAEFRWSEHVRNDTKEEK